MNKELTPYSVPGKVEYEKLTKEFGTSVLSPSLLNNIKTPHPILRRGLYFSHRDFDLWLSEAKAGKKVSIVSGRGPSEKMHIGHLVPFLAVKSLQEQFDCPVFIPISEDEKFFVKNSLSFENAEKFAEDNIIDILALGFKKEKTFITLDFKYAPIYPYAARVAKLISYSTAKAVFGLQSENNIGWSFYPAMQAAHILLPQFLHGKHRTLVPVAIDQDPFIRLTRDIAEHSSLKFVKPAAIHAKFIPSLHGKAKMSSSSEIENEVIYLSDTPEEVKRKINKYAFSGGKDTEQEHRKHGGNPDIDVSFQYLKYLFEEDDKKLKKIEQDYRSGKLLSGELKKILIDKISAFLKEHQKNREKVKKEIKNYLI
jgi:tryptophanyl-tRNA synthetase